MYDIIVIGAGSGGLNVASFMAKAGFKTLIIDKSDRSIGGDCLNFGCVPSKALIHTANLAKAAKSISKFGLKVTGNVSLKKISEYVRSKKEVIRKHENAQYLTTKKGIEVALGLAKFVNKNTVQVGDKTYQAKKIIIATGSRPRQLNVPGVEKVHYHTNESIFDLEKLPKHLAIIGGGPIGMELGQAFLRLGSKVTIIQRGPDFLPKESKDVTSVLFEQLKKEGMNFIFNATPSEFKSKTELLVRSKDGTKYSVKFDCLLAAIGRQLNIENLNLEAAGVNLDESKRRLVVDKYLRTTNKNILVCGDVAGGYQFTHAAEVHAGVIITNFFKPFLKKKVSYDNFSWVTFTDPQIATFGLNEKELAKRSIIFEKLTLKFTDDDRAIVDEQTYGKSVLFIDGKGKILGGTMVAKDAGELFQEFVLAKTHNLGLKHLFAKTYPYPTASRVNKSIAGQFFSRKLTSNAKKILHFMYKWN